MLSVVLVLPHAHQGYSVRARLLDSPGLVGLWDMLGDMHVYVFVHMCVKQYVVFREYLVLVRHQIM